MPNPMLPRYLETLRETVHRARGPRISDQRSLWRFLRSRRHFFDGEEWRNITRLFSRVGDAAVADTLAQERRAAGGLDADPNRITRQDGDARAAMAVRAILFPAYLRRSGARPRLRSARMAERAAQRPMAHFRR